MAKSQEFAENVIGFYVRVEGDGDKPHSVAIIDAVRMGRPYAIPDIKFYTKYLLLSQPPFPKFTTRILKISDEPITMDEVERWEASLAILQISSSHRIDPLEAKRRKVAMKDSISSENQPAPQNRAGSTSNLMNNTGVQELSVENPIEIPDSPKELRSSIALFENLSSTKTELPASPPQKKKYDISKFLPAPSDKPIEIVKASTSGSSRKELSSTSVKVSLLARAFESSGTIERNSPRPPKGSSLKSDSTSLTNSDDSISILSKSAEIVHEQPEEETQNSPQEQTKDLDTKNNLDTAKEIQIEIEIENNEEPIAKPSNDDVDTIEEPEKGNTQTNVLQEEKSKIDTTAAENKLVSELKKKKKKKKTNTVADEEVKDQESPIARKTASQEDVTTKKRRKSKRVKTEILGEDTPSRDSESFSGSNEDVCLRATPKRRKNKKKRGVVETKMRANTVFERPVIHDTAANETASFLDSIALRDDADSFLDDDKRKKKKKRKKSNKYSDKLSDNSAENITTRIGSADSVQRDSTTKGGSAQNLSLDIVPSKEPEETAITPGRNTPSRHKRSKSSEDVAVVKDQVISPRNLNLDMPHVLSQIVIPVCSLPGSQEWEIKKIRHFEKLAKQRVKEKATLDTEIQLAKQKLEQDTQTHTTAIALKQQQERKAFQKKIQLDKSALSMAQIQEKKALEKLLQKEKDEANTRLHNVHDAKEKQRIGEFEKQVELVKKANRDANDTGEELIDHLKNAHDACMNRESHKRVLHQLQLFHKLEYENMKRRQEIEKKHVKAMQQLERDVLIQQLSLTQKQLRQRRWVILDDIRARENTHRQLQEKRHQMEMRHENAGQDLAFKLLTKQHQMEREYIGKNIQTHHKQGNLHHQKQKKTLKANFQANTRKIRSDKSLSKEDIRLKIDQLKAELDEQIGQLEEQLVSSQATDIQDHALQVRHFDQISQFKKERKRRRDVLLLYHQKEKNILQNKLDEDRKEIEVRMKGNVEAFHQEEEEMKKAFTEANETNLWSLQQRHWLEAGDLQKANHEEQQQLISNIQSELEARVLPPKKLVDEGDQVDEEELKRQQEEQERLQREQQELQEQLERQLEEQQEAEKKQLEEERAQEQEKLIEQIEEEKKEVMETKIEEDEDTLRLEYIRKIANETGLSEDLIAAQLDRIGMPSFMF